MRYFGITPSGFCSFRGSYRIIIEQKYSIATVGWVEARNPTNYPEPNRWVSLCSTQPTSTKGKKGRWYKPIKWWTEPNPPGYIICVSANTRIAIHGLEDNTLIPISEHCKTVLKSCGECSDIKVVYTGKDLVFDVYSLDGKEVDLKISRHKRTGEVYEVEFKSGCLRQQL